MFEHSVHVSNENLKLDYLRIRDNASSSLACGFVTLQIEHAWACLCISPTNNLHWYTVSSLKLTQMKWLSIRPEFIKILFPKMLSVDMQLNTEPLLRFTCLDYILARPPWKFNRPPSNVLHAALFGYCSNFGSNTDDRCTLTLRSKTDDANLRIKPSFFFQTQFLCLLTFWKPSLRGRRPLYLYDFRSCICKILLGYKVWCPHIEACHFSPRIYSDIADIIF